MKKSGITPHQVDEQVSDANVSRRRLIQLTGKPINRTPIFQTAA